MPDLFEYKLVKKHALKNAIEHKGKANQKAVISRVLGENPGLKTEMKTLVKTISAVLKEISRLSVDEQTAVLQEIAPELLEKKEQRQGLPELPDVSERVVVRFAPNVNGPMHLGRTRIAVLRIILFSIFCC